MPHWSCSSVLCYNNYATVSESGAKMGKYKLPSDPETQAAYMRIFRTTETFDWEKGYICAGHWTSGVRENSKHLPDLVLAPGQFDLIQKKYERAKLTFTKASKPSSVQRNTYNMAKAKYEAAKSVMSAKPAKSRPSPKKRQLSCSSTCVTATSTLVVPTHDTPTSPLPTSSPSAREDEILWLKNLLAEKDLEIASLKETIATKSRKIDALKIEAIEKVIFSFENISQDPEKFEYLTGLSMEQFSLLMVLIRPYIGPCLKYGERNATERTFSYETQYLIVMMVCRHGLDFKFAAYMADVSPQTIGRIYNGWVIFLAALFSKLNTRPQQKFLQEKMPKIFRDTGHGETDLILDATEFRFQSASNFDISSLMFSHYKNTHTGKALIGIAPHGMGIIFSDIYPGSISDTEITEKTGILGFVAEDHEVMSDRGFSIQDLCAIKGVTLNRPKQKDAESGKFTQPECHQHFNITSTRIHVERFIGRVRNWRILNCVWPMNRIDLLAPTWQVLCHTVNLLFPPIGPTEDTIMVEETITTSQ